MDRRTEPEARLRALSDAVPDAVVTADERGTILSFNPAAERMFGWSAPEVIGRNVRLLAAEPHRSGHDGYLARYREGGRPLVLGVPREVEGIRRDGTLVPLDLTVAEGWFEGQRFFTAVLRDITERTQARRQLEDRSAALEAQARCIAEQNAALAQVSRHKSELLANVSHELRTPLHAIDGFAGLLLDGAAGPLAPRQREYAERIALGARQLTALVDDIVDLKRVEVGRLLLDPAAIDAAAVFGGAVDMVAPQAAARGVRLEAAVAPEVDGFVADGLRLYQVAANLLANAVKFTPAGGEARLEVRRLCGPDRLALAVDDTGVGIPPEELGRLFQPFVRLTGAAGVPGTGLGLALVKRLVELHGGTIEVSSRPGAGARFLVTIPAPPARVSGGIHVLLVSVPEAVAARLRVVVGDAAEVSIAPDAVAAWSMAAVVQPDVVLVGGGAPGGASPLDQLRAHPVLARTPGAALGADGVPLDPEAAHLRALLRRLAPALRDD